MTRTEHGWRGSFVDDAEAKLEAGDAGVGRQDVNSLSA